MVGLAVQGLKPLATVVRPSGDESERAVLRERPRAYVFAGGSMSGSLNVRSP